jgi:hypothetical protein
MDPTDVKTINDIYVKILKTGRRLYDSENSPECEGNTVCHAQKLESYSTYLGQMNDKLEHILKISDKYANECFTKATEIREFVNLHDKYKDDEFPLFSVNRELYKNLDWGHEMEMEDKKNEILDNIKNITEKKNIHEYKPIMYKNVKDLYSTKIDFDWKIPIINRLNEMTPSLYWYNGDKNNPKGVYTCLSNGFNVQVPFPNTIDGTKDFNRVCSIKCKYNTTVDCLKVRQDLSNKFNSDIRPCNFAHAGEKYSKLGTSFRCPNIPRFGNHMFLNNDLNKLPDYDMKMMLMYSLSDVLLSSMWFQKHKIKKLLLTNIDTC